MIDHVLGRPSSKFRKLQVFIVVSFWSSYILQGNPHGPPFIRRISERIGKKLTAWQTVVLTMLWLYFCRNFAKISGLASPEPLANLYTRSYFRATWVTTALDAGYWTAMPIGSKRLRDLCSVLFSVFYLFAAETADDKVRKVRATLTVEHLRVSWNKSTSPYLGFLNSLLRPRFCKYPPRKIRIARPPESVYKEPVIGWLYFDGPLTALSDHNKMILDVPGGGFVAMDPRNHDDKLLAWAGKLGLPVLSLDYQKAPEYPYPYALNEVFDVYSTLVQSRGRCIGMSGIQEPRIVMTGDSAGGNLATGALLMLLQAATLSARRSPRERKHVLPTPEGLILIYPGLDMNIGNWMTDEQMSLIQDRRTRKTNASILRRKSQDYYKLTPKTPRHSDVEDADNGFMRRTETIINVPQLKKNILEDSAIVDEPEENTAEASMAKDTRVRSRRTSHTISRTDPKVDDEPADVWKTRTDVASSKPKILKTRLAMSSMISYFNDRILTPEMMRSMIILYIGPHNRPDFATDFLLSPVLAPDSLLAKFPKTYFLTGERDPLVDDTVIMAGRIRQAKYAEWVSRKEMGLEQSNREFDEKEHVEVKLIEGISHGFMQFVGVYPQGWRYIFRCSDWAREIFRENDEALLSRRRDHELELDKRQSRGSINSHDRHHVRRPTESSGDDEPLEMSTMTRIRSPEKEETERRSSGVRKLRRRRSLDRQKSSVSLASEDDLLGRRMNGLTGGLMGINGDD